MSGDKKYICILSSGLGTPTLTGGTKVVDKANGASSGTHDGSRLIIYKNVPSGAVFKHTMSANDYTYYPNYSRWMCSWSVSVLEFT